ncbi:MAG: hypothetical protein ACRDSH_24715 [Pseudonocardiaceae bacterium]
MTGQTARIVHSVPMPEGHQAGVVGTLCGALLNLEEIEILIPGQGMPCMVCGLNQISATRPVVEPAADSAASTDVRSVDGADYQAWGWPVTHHPDQILLGPRDEASAIAIPILLSTAVTQILTTQGCVPAVVAHPYTPEHHIVLTGERFGVTLPWPPGVYQILGALILPPTMTPRGPLTWIQPPCQDSLRLSREIDVFGALRTVLSNSPSKQDPPPCEVMSAELVY